MPSLTKSDPRAVLRGVPEKSNEFRDALDLQERIVALCERSDALQAQLPADPMDVRDLFLKRIKCHKILCADQDLLRLLAKYDELVVTHERSTS